MKHAADLLSLYGESGRWPRGRMRGDELSHRFGDVARACPIDAVHRSFRALHIQMILQHAEIVAHLERVEQAARLAHGRRRVKRRAT